MAWMGHTLVKVMAIRYWGFSGKAIFGSAKTSSSLSDSNLLMWIFSD
jgi:hypothetical protein